MIEYSDNGVRIDNDPNWIASGKYVGAHRSDYKPKPQENKIMLSTYKVLAPEGCGISQTYLGISRYNDQQEIPIRNPDHCETWLAFVKAIGELEVWIVQVAPSVNGFAELKRYYELNYGCTIKMHRVQISTSVQEFVVL